MNISEYKWILLNDTQTKPTRSTGILGITVHPISDPDDLGMIWARKCYFRQLNEFITEELFKGVLLKFQVRILPEVKSNFIKNS